MKASTSGASSLSPREFEELTKELLEKEGARISFFKVTGSRVLSAPDGDYQIDVSVDFELLGARFKVLVECKRYSGAIEREVVQLLKGKLDSLGAQKGIIVTTSTFQSGAVKYARQHGIALVEVRSARLVYRTRSLDQETDLPVGAPPYVGMACSFEGERETRTQLGSYPKTLWDLFIPETQ